MELAGSEHVDARGQLYAGRVCACTRQRRRRPRISHRVLSGRVVHGRESRRGADAHLPWRHLMKVKNGFFFGLSLLLLLPLGYFIYDRIEFVRTARKTSAIVEQVTGRNDSCGRKRARYACTKFQATL